MHFVEIFESIGNLGGRERVNEFTNSSFLNRLLIRIDNGGDFFSLSLGSEESEEAKNP